MVKASSPRTVSCNQTWANGWRTSRVDQSSYAVRNRSACLSAAALHQRCPVSDAAAQIENRVADVRGVACSMSLCMIAAQTFIEDRRRAFINRAIIGGDRALSVVAIAA
jgi:hypothetical protein